MNGIEVPGAAAMELARNLPSEVSEEAVHRMGVAHRFWELQKVHMLWMSGAGEFTPDAGVGFWACQRSTLEGGRKAPPYYTPPPVHTNSKASSCPLRKNKCLKDPLICAEKTM